MFVVPEVFDCCKPTGHTGILVQVVYDGLAYIQVVRVTCGLWRKGKRFSLRGNL